VPPERSAAAVGGVIRASIATRKGMSELNSPIFTLSLMEPREGVEPTTYCLQNASGASRTV